MMNEAISSEDPPQNETSTLECIVESLRINLYTLKGQGALHSPLDVPQHLKNAIQITTGWLEQNEAQLHELQTGEHDRLSQTKQLRQHKEVHYVSAGCHPGRRCG